MNKRIFYLSLPILVLALGLVISGIPRVHAGPGNFTIQATGPIEFPAGQGASSNVKVNSTGGFSGTINVGATASPAGLTASCAPPSVSITPTSNGTTSCNLSSTAPGTYTLTISGSNGTAGGPGVVTHSVNVAVTVISFTSSLSPSGVTFNSGSSGKAVLTMVPSVFNETVNLSSSSVPPTGLTVQFSLTSLVLNTKGHFTANSTLTFSSSVPNVYNVTITGTPVTAGHPPVSFNAIVNVQGYTLSPSPSSFFREKWGDTFTSTISLTALTGFSGTVNLAAQPAVGFGFAFSPTSVPLSAGGTGSSVLTITLGTPAPGNVTTIATGSSTVSGGTLVNTANIQVQVVGLICVSDPNNFAGTGTCPATPYLFSGPAPGAPQVSPTQIRIGVFAQGSGFLNGADITLLTNNNVLKPYAIDLSGSILPGANTILECLNGVLIVGTTCAGTDIVNATYGTIHASIAAGSGLHTNDNSTGLLFTAIYNITATSPAAAVTIGFQTGCTATSIVNHVTCVTINNGSTKPVPEVLRTADFLNQGGNSTYPFIAVTTVNPVITVNFNSPAPATVTARAENGWPVGSADSISFTAVATPGFSAPAISGTPCSTLGTNCNATIIFNTGTPGTYFVTVFGAYVATDLNASLVGSGLTVSLIAPITFQVNVQDAVWTINGVITGPSTQVAQTYQVPLGGPTPSLVYTVQSFGGFTGTVMFTTKAGGTGLNLITSCTTACYGAPFTLLAGSTVTRVINVTTTTAVLGANVPWQPQMTAGALVKSGTIDNIHVNGFTISPASTTVSFATGGSATDVMTLTSTGGTTNGFAGNVTVTGSSTPAIGLVVTCNYPIVPRAGSATSNCRFISATPGTYNVIITGAGGSNNAIKASTATISVTVSGDFAIGASPTSVTISSIGGRGDSTITVTSQNSLAGTVNLSSSVTLASGLACSLNPTSIVLGTSGTSTLSCVSSNTGKFNVTVTGAFTGPDGLTLTHALNVTYTISTSQTTTTTVSCLPNSVVVGSSTSCTATVTGASTAPSGMVSFSNGAASGGFSPLSCNLGTPSGNSASCSVNYTPTAVGSGSHSITATYQGDTTHSGSVSTPFALTVAKASPTITTTPSSTSINTGQTASDSASFGAGSAFQPSGTVTYRLFPTVTSGVCSGTPGIVSIVTISNTGTIPNSRAVTFNTTGTFGFEASYPGDANNNAATGSCEPVVVSSGVHTTTTAITCTPGSVVVGTSTSCMATVTDTSATPTNPGGTVTITANGAGTFTPSNGQCTLTASGTNAATCSVSYTPSAVGTGSQSISASYGGDATHSTSQSTTPFALTITKSSPAITTTPSTSSIVVGGTASDSASFTTGTAFQPTGSVSYLVFPIVTGGVCSGTSSTASIVIITGVTIPSSRSVIFNSTGTFGFEASYPGDANNNAATGPCEPVTVNKATPSLTTAISPSSTVTQGTAVTDHATITGGFPSTGVTGSVSYFFFTGGACAGTATSESTVTIGAGNSVPASNSVTPASVGQFSFNATYGGDGNNNRVSSTCEPLTVQNLPVPTLTTTIKNAAGASITSVVIGNTVHDSATISGGSGTITGTVTYSFFANVGCVTPAASTQAVTITSGNVVPDSSASTPSPAGSFSFQASYGGDANNGPTTSACEPLTVTKTTPSITTAVSPSSTITVGSSVTDQATLTGGFPSTGVTGSVTYAFFSNGACTGTPTSTSTATIGASNSVPVSSSLTPPSTGSFAFNATYGGDVNNNRVSSSCEPLTVNKQTPTITTTISPSSTVTPGTVVTDHATLSNGFPSTGVTGTVSYFFFTGSGCTGTATPEGIVTIGAGNSIPASNSVTASAAGSFSFNATYSGDSNNNRVSSACEPLTVQNLPVPSLTTSIKNAAGTAVTSVQVGAVLHDSATISGGSGTITGTVAYHFFFNGVCSGASSVSQTVTILTGNAVPDSSPATPTPGSYSYNATYGGDANNAGVTSACEPLTVTKAAPSITSIVTPSAVTLGQSATDLASVTGGFTPTGTVTYTAYSNVGCTTLVFTSANIPLGTHSAAFTAASAGTFQWIAAYNGDVNNTAVSTACGAEPLTVNNATPSITTSISPSSTVTPGTAVTDHATITGGFPSSGVTGSVSYFFFTGGTCAGAATSEGTVTIGAANSVPASNSVTPTTAGLFSFNATYSGDGNNNRVSSACELLAIQTLPVPAVSTTIKNTAGAVVTSVVVGTAVHDSATISGGSGTITGTVTYSFFANFGCTSPAASTQAVTITSGNVVPDSSASTPSPAGSFSFQASYAGDANNGPATSACEPLTVNKTSPTLSTLLSSNSITVGNAVSDSATLTSSFQAGGTVVYSVFSNNICAAPGNVVSTVTVTGGVIPNSRLVTFNSTGDFGFQASYSGDANNSVAVSSCEPLTVSTGVSIQTTVSSATITVGGSATDSATLAGQSATASGTVTYTDFTNGVCAAPVKTVSVVTVTNGIVPNSRAVLFNSTGSFSFQAAYSGDPANNAAISPCEPLSVQKANPSITTTPSSSTITVGQSVTDSATLSNFFQAGGSVIYSVFNNGACTPAGTVASVVTVTNGAVPNSRAVMFNATGSYSFQAVYSGDSNNNGANSSCELVTVSPPPIHTTTTAVVCSPSSLQLSTATSCTATVADSSASPTTPTGTISFTTNSTGTFTPVTCALAGTTVGTASCSVSYTPTVIGHHLITASYGGDSTHSASTGSFKLSVSSAAPPPVHSTITVVTCSPGSVLVNTSTSCTARVIDNSTSPTVPTGTVTFASNSTGTFNPSSASCTLAAGNAPNMATCSVSYTPTAAGKHLITGSYAGDASHAQSNGSFTLNVRSRPGGSVLLTFNGFELDDFNNGIGQLDVLVNGQLVVNLPAGLNSLTGTGDYKPYENVAVDFGPFDITNLMVNGQNTILFRDPTSFDHFGVVRNVSIIQGSTILLQVPRARGVYPGFSFSYTFSNPPLMLTGITASSTSPVVAQALTFTVNYTGGTGPVNCVFLFGDGGSAVVQGINGTCTAIHHYFDSGSFIVRVIISGSSTSDRVRGNLSLTVANDSTEA